MSNEFCPGCFKEYVIDLQNKCIHCGFDENMPTPDNALKPHTIIGGKFMLGKVLNIDGEGIEYLAFDGERKNIVVIKEYMPASLCVRMGLELQPKPGCETKYKFLLSDFKELFLGLIDCNLLKHIRKVYEVIDDNSTAYVVLEDVDGKSLNQHIIDNAGELDFEDALDLFKPLLEDLTVINSARIIHRGITPQSIILTKDGELKLTGFSVSSAKSKNSEIDTNITDGYAAPEQYSANIPHGARTDVYAVCAVLYKTLGGVMPPSAQTRVINDNLINLASLNSAIPVHISVAVMNGLAYDYKERTQNIRTLISALYSSDYEYNTSEVYTKVDTYEDEEPQQKEKKELSIMVKALLISAPIILIFVVLLYISIFNVDIFGSSGDDDDDTSTSSDILDTSDDSDASDDLTSSDITDDTSDETSTSSETSSEPEVEQAIVVDFKNNFFTDVETSTQYTALFTFAAEYEYNEELISGLIISQDIAPDTEVDVGTLITFKVSKGSKFFDIPTESEITSMKATDLETMIKDAGIDARIVFEPHETAQLGIVTRLEGATPGTQIDIESGVTVIIYASSGQAPPDTSSEPESEPVDTSTTE